LPKRFFWWLKAIAISTKSDRLVNHQRTQLFKVRTDLKKRLKSCIKRILFPGDSKPSGFPGGENFAFLDQRGVIIMKLIYVFLLILAVRLASVFVVQTYYVPDEYWQSLEVAHKLTFG